MQEPPPKVWDHCDYCTKKDFKKEADFDDHLATKCKALTSCFACKEIVQGIELKTHWKSECKENKKQDKFQLCTNGCGDYFPAGL